MLGQGWSRLKGDCTFVVIAGRLANTREQWKHTILKYYHHQVDMMNVLAHSCLSAYIQQSNISTRLETCFWPLGQCKSNIHSLLALFSLHRLLSKNIQYDYSAAKCSTFFMSLLLSVCLSVCYLLGQVVYSGFLELSADKAACCIWKWDESGDSEQKKSKVGNITPKQWAERH